MKKIKVLVVDDSAFMRKVISDIINSQNDMQVVGVARNGEEALQKAQELGPDVVTLDVEMPVMDGITALKKIMETDPVPVVMLSSLTQNGAEMTMKALQLGAVDFVPKPSGTISLDIAKVSEDIVRKVRIAALARPQIRRLFSGAGSLGSVARPVSPGIPLSRPVGGRLEKLVLIGTSTGGPKALHEVIPRLPGDLEAGVLIVQHMPPGFTASLAARLDGISGLRVKEAEHGEVIAPGTAYVAPGDYHLLVMTDKETGLGRLLVNLTFDPPVSGHRPSVDAMFESVARSFWGHIVGVIMTGMGQDGAKGVIHLKKRGAKIIAEDSSTCIVFGMPKAAIETGQVDKVVPLPEIAQEIQRML